MEPLGDFWNGEWDWFAAMAMLSSLQELDPSQNNSNSTELQLPNNGSWFYWLDAFDPNLQSSVKQGMRCSSCSTDNCSGSFFFANSRDLFVPVDEVDKGFTRAIRTQPPLPPPQLVDSSVGGNEPINNSDLVSDSLKNKTRVSADAEKKKKKQKRRGENGEEEGNAQGQSSEEDNGSQECHGASATRGSATDPQSVYARKRRERINERLKILQKLVPNGTKVDISTMLEEAVHYVKFLQLQIKLLSSDDMWMFAPLAYNGMDIGLHQKLSPFL